MLLFQDLVEVFLEYWLWSSGSEVKGFDLGVLLWKGDLRKSLALETNSCLIMFFMTLDACEGPNIGSMAH